MEQKESHTNWHFRISLVKSALRIFAGVALLNNLYATAGGLLIVAEVLGVIEEL